MSSFVLRFFGFGHLNRSVLRGLGPKIDKMGCPDFGPQIGHFRGGSAPRARFLQIPGIFGHQYRGILANHEGVVLFFLSLFDNLPFRPSKTRARAEGLRRETDEKKDKNGPKTPHSPSRFMLRGNGPKRRTPFVNGNSARLALGRPKRPRRLKVIKAEISLNF